MALTRQPLSVAIATCAQLGVPVAAAAPRAGPRDPRAGEDAALLVPRAVVTIAITAAMSAGWPERPAPPPRVPPYRGRHAGAAMPGTPTPPTTPAAPA